MKTGKIALKDLFTTFPDPSRLRKDLRGESATMPSLVLLSRTRAYSASRTGGALLAGAAAVGWIAERLLGLHNPVDLLVNSVTSHALWIAGILFLSSVIACSLGGWRVRPDCDSREPNAEPA